MSTDGKANRRQASWIFEGDADPRIRKSRSTARWAIGAAVLVLYAYIASFVLPYLLPPRPAPPLAGFVLTSVETASPGTPCTGFSDEDGCGPGPEVAGYDLGLLPSFAAGDRTCYRAGDTILFCSDPASTDEYFRYELVNDQDGTDSPNNSGPDWLSGIGNLLAGFGAIATAYLGVIAAKQVRSRMKKDKPPISAEKGDSQSKRKTPRRRERS